MPEVADAAIAERKGSKSSTKKQGLAAIIRKRWRAWLRAIHRDIGYLAVGFTVIYALSGIAMNHIDDWDPNFHSSEITKKITPVPDDISDAEAAKRVGEAAGLGGKAGAVTDVYRAGDEVRLTYANGSKVTAIGDTLTIQSRRDRLFFRVADWLHTTRGKQAWKYIADTLGITIPRAMELSDQWIREGCRPDSRLLSAERAALVRAYASLLAAVHHQER